MLQRIYVCKYADMVVFNDNASYFNNFYPFRGLFMIYDDTVCNALSC